MLKLHLCIPKCCQFFILLSEKIFLGPGLKMRWDNTSHSSPETLYLKSPCTHEQTASLSNLIACNSLSFSSIPLSNSCMACSLSWSCSCQKKKKEEEEIRWKWCERETIKLSLFRLYRLGRNFWAVIYLNGYMLQNFMQQTTRI